MLRERSKRDLDTALREVTTDAPAVHPETDAFDAFVQLNASGGDAALVGDDAGVVGVLTNDDFARILSLSREAGPGPRVAA
jgi:CBS domain-containing protein